MELFLPIMSVKLLLDIDLQKKKKKRKNTLQDSIKKKVAYQNLDVDNFQNRPIIKHDYQTWA